MRTVLAGLFVIALVGCPEEVPETSGVCEAADRSDGPLCFEIADGGITHRRQCDEETLVFVADTTCAELDYTELCLDENGFVVYGDSAETCAGYNSGEVEKPDRDR